jgi:hypothetical protein
MASPGKLMAQPFHADVVGKQVYDSIEIDPLKISEAGIVTASKKILSLKSARKLLAQAFDANDKQAAALASLNISDAYIAHGNNRNALIQLAATLKMSTAFQDEKAVSHLYYDAAIVFARQKNYVSAMKYFYKTGYVYQQTFFKKKRRHFFSVNTSATWNAGEIPGNNVADNLLVSSVFSDSIVNAGIFNADTSSMIDNPFAEESPFMDYGDILNIFEDGKAAFAYGIMVHLKQPVPGKKNIFVRLNKVGHTFITLIKFNADSTVVSKTFGFYPEKISYLSATPLFPSTQSVFKDDKLHDWDEVIGKFIGRQQFETILAFIEATGSKKYNLNNNNCTDMGLKIASIANIEIQDTKGYWPMGRGNNPASTGQSILKGKFKNKDTNTQHGLFACSNNLFIKRSN